MKRSRSISFWGKLSFFYIIFNFAFISFSASNIQAENSPAETGSLKRVNTQSTTINIQATGPVIYKTHFFDNPPCLILNFAPQVLYSKLNPNIIVNRGIIKSIKCAYYGSSGWLKSISFILLAKTNYQIKEENNNILISIVNTPEQSINTALADELVIRDYMPQGAGSMERREALRAAIKFVRIKRQMLKSLTGVVEPSVLIEKRSDNSVRVTAVNLTPAEMITTGTKALFNQPVNLEAAKIDKQGITQAYPKLPIVVSKENLNLKQMSFGFTVLLLGILAAGRAKIKNTKHLIKSQKIIIEKQKKEKNGIEELFLKEEELRKWSKYDNQTKTTVSQSDETHVSSEVFNFPSSPSDIAERRRFPRADIRNTRGILNKALVGSKTQPFKNVKINDISKGGLSFQVKSREAQFKSPTILKLYFSNSTKPVDLWVKVVWEKYDLVCDSKNVGVKFTRVPKESWERILESFGHRLG